MDRTHDIARLYDELAAFARRARWLSAGLHPGLSLVAYTLLSHAAGEPDVRAADLAERYALDKSTVSRQIALLEQQGLLHRSGERPGRRGHVLEVTKGLEVLTNVVFAWIEPFLANILVTTVVMYWAGFIYHFFLASEISMLGSSMPLVMEFAKSHGMNPLVLGLIWMFSAGGKLFAYQSGVLIVGYSYGYFEARDLVRIGLWLTIVEFFALMLLVPFYWPLIGLQ